MNQELIDKYREINVDYDDWYEHVYEWFDEECQSRGIEVMCTLKNTPHGQRKLDFEIQWSGFWSQGDGAAFSGRICGKDVNKALGDFMQDYPIFSKYINEIDGYFIFRWNVGRGNNIRIEGIDSEEIGAYLDFDHPFTEIWQSELNVELDSIECQLTDLVEDMCGLLYKTLRDEYDHLTSDEAVWETIVANELDKESEDETT